MRVVRGQGGKVLPVQVPGNHPDRESVLPGAKNRRSPDAGAEVELERSAILLPEGLEALMPGNELAGVSIPNQAGDVPKAAKGLPEASHSLGGYFAGVLWVGLEVVDRGEAVSWLGFL